MEIDSAPEVTVAASPPASVPVVDTADAIINNHFETVSAFLNTLKTQLVPLQSQLRALEKLVQKELKQRPSAAKKKERARKSLKPGRVSPALSQFLQVGAEVLFTRPDVTRLILEYTARNNLQQGPNITADAGLKKLLALPDGEQLTVFNLDRHLLPHFVI
jgi:hypothetical protein